MDDKEQKRIMEGKAAMHQANAEQKAKDLKAAKAQRLKLKKSQREHLEKLANP